MDDHQLCLGARNEYRSNVAGVIPSYRTYRPRGCVSFTHIIAQVGTLLGALYGYIVSDIGFFLAGLSHSNYHLSSRPG
jgi:hypothetical protein